MGELVAGIELALFQQVRKYSRWAVGIAIAASLVFSQVIESSENTWQVVIAVIALAIGIPHGALDHLVTLPKSSAIKMATFIAVYVAVAVIAVILLLTWNVAGFIFVVAMSAVHFGIGDAAFISEIDRRTSDSMKFPRFSYAAAGGALPVVIPLVSDKSSAALERVNSSLINWHQGLNDELLLLTLAIFVVALLRLLQKRRISDAIDLSLLYFLALTAPPLVAFAVYFGCWHAMRHTARLTLALPRSQKSYEEGRSTDAFLSAIWPGVPALVGTFVVAGIVIAFRGGSVSDQFLWITLVIVWALTVPHMAVTARLDRKALN
jgi:Brp/Blh family beta-carotene 15,15'-monooxygenase